ncbi:hypothetical protein GCM10008090_27560 [Arenicella chitinivorans]|uniref:Uncharacterized protein n=1 Tax=Arenicella chitinivorans TaxID=1329800 RepID=A0A918VQT3_9GAMM|nr:hypothetical protein [Arenicella chitinivorans]GHA16244.1 hypothetical protein GCM10008090_27560 [Arenicella chitinivorans]
MYKVTLLLSLLFLCTPAGAHDSVFYCVYQTNECVESSDPIPIENAEINRILGDVVAGASNFIGFVDRHGTTIQFYVDQPGDIWVEIPSPENKGSFGKRISNNDMMLLVKKLEAPYWMYKGTLKLKFTKW